MAYGMYVHIHVALCLFRQSAWHSVLCGACTDTETDTDIALPSIMDHAPALLNTGILVCDTANPRPYTPKTLTSNLKGALFKAWTTANCLLQGSGAPSYQRSTASHAMEGRCTQWMAYSGWILTTLSWERLLTTSPRTPV